MYADLAERTTASLLAEAGALKTKPTLTIDEQVKLSCIWSLLVARDKLPKADEARRQLKVALWTAFRAATKARDAEPDRDSAKRLQAVVEQLRRWLEDDGSLMRQTPYGRR